MNRDVPAQTMYYRWLAMPAGATYTWETANLAPGTDTVLHLWNWGTSAEVAYNDDYTGLASRMTYTNNTGSSQLLIVVMRSYSSVSVGSADVLQNGSLLASAAPVAGQLLSVENAPGYVHETVMAPGGASNPMMLALNGSRRLVDLDYSGGVATQSRVSHDSASWVVVGAVGSSTAGNVHVYSNDPTDNDGDGLGEGLEADLGTCDLAAWAHCGAVNNLEDTDRDGLPDAAEVFGIDHSINPQHLPAWGADPLHKDVFVEIDISAAIASSPFDEADALLVQEIFDEGPAADLVNPDGVDGVRVHLDMGVNPTDPALNTLYGDWGGASSVPVEFNYLTAAGTYRDSVRTDIFRYALMTLGGGGQAEAIPADKFGWGVSETHGSPVTFAHELGHAVGIAHHGHSSWGAANGKANYLSLMNYAYPGANFSMGESTVTLNPALVNEDIGISADASHVAAAPYNRTVDPSGAIDWDYSDDFTGGGWGSSRAPITFGTGGTGALSTKEQKVHIDVAKQMPATTPALVRGPGDRLYTFYVDGTRIKYRHALVNGSSHRGSCPGDDSVGGPDCTTWSDAYEVPTSAGARGVTALWSDGQMLLAFRTHVDSLRTIRAPGVDASGELTGWTGERWHYANTDKEPELELLRVDPTQFGGDDLVVAILYRERDSGRYDWRTLADVDSAFSYAQGGMVTDTGDLLYGTQSPTFTAWPYDAATSDLGTSCGAITNELGQIGMYCYDPVANRFIDQSTTAFVARPTTFAKPGLAYHAYRSWWGTPYAGDETRGAFWLSVAVDGESLTKPRPWDYVKMWISSPISEQAGEGLDDLFFPAEASGLAGNQWTDMHDGAGLALYDDADLGAMKGMWIRHSESDETDNDDREWALRFLPLADGTFRAALKDGNDFQIMEKGICRGLVGAAYCGSSSFGLD